MHAWLRTAVGILTSTCLITGSSSNHPSSCTRQSDWISNRKPRRTRARTRKSPGEGPRGKERQKGERGAWAANLLVAKTAPCQNCDAIHDDEVCPHCLASLPISAWPGHKTSTIQIASWNCGGSLRYHSSALRDFMYSENMDVFLLQPKKPIATRNYVTPPETVPGQSQNS